MADRPTAVVRVVLREMVAGARPFGGGGLDEVVGRIRSRRLGRDVWPAAASESASAVVAFTASMLTASRSARPATARAFSPEAHKSPSCGLRVRFALPGRQILYSLNKPDDFILALVLFGSGDDDTPRVRYVRRPFQREPDFGAASVNYALKDLLATAEDPRQGGRQVPTGHPPERS